MDLYFQGRAWFSKGVTPEHMARAGGFFQRALTIDPCSVEVLVGMALVDLSMGAALLTDDRGAKQMRSMPFHSPLITQWPTLSWVAFTFGQTVLPKGLLNASKR